MNGALIGHYDWRGGREALLRFGPAAGPMVIAALPLFEEANRTRAFMVSILRVLAERGIASVLPDLPGQGESLVPLESVTLTDMRDAFAAACEQPNGGARLFGVAMRSGALLDTTALLAGRWRLSPQDGPTLLRELKRLKQAGHPPDTRLDDGWWQEGPVEIAGNRVSSEFLAGLHAATPIDTPAIRTVRLESDAQPADRKLPGRPLWRSAEPDNNLALVQLVADDIVDWVGTCGG